MRKLGSSIERKTSVYIRQQDFFYKTSILLFFRQAIPKFFCNSSPWYTRQGGARLKLLLFSQFKIFSELEIQLTEEENLNLLPLASSSYNLSFLLRRSPTVPWKVGRGRVIDSLYSRSAQLAINENAAKEPWMARKRFGWWTLDDAPRLEWIGPPPPIPKAAKKMAHSSSIGNRRDIIYIEKKRQQRRQKLSREINEI